jgi:hypothetical protein
VGTNHVDRVFGTLGRLAGMPGQAVPIFTDPKGKSSVGGVVSSFCSTILSAQSSDDTVYEALGNASIVVEERIKDGNGHADGATRSDQDAQDRAQFVKR